MNMCGWYQYNKNGCNHDNMIRGLRQIVKIDKWYLYKKSV